MPHVTVPSTPAQHQYVVGADAQATFAVTFPFFSLSGLTVHTIDENGVVNHIQYSATPTTNSQFSSVGDVVDGGYSGGYITVGGGGVQNVTITIRREIPPERTTDIPYPQRFLDVGRLNTELDLLTARLNDMELSLSRAAHVSDAAVISTDGMEIVSPIAGRALKWNNTATGLENSDHDPDEAWFLTSTAAASAAAAATSAADAASRAAAALAAATDSGAGSFTAWGPITLQVGVTDYLLPDQPSSAQTVTLFYGSVFEAYNPSDPKWTITDAIAAGRTLHLNVAVTADGAGETFKAGNVISGTLVGALRGDALGAGAVGNRELGDGAVGRTSAIANGVVAAANVVPGADLSAFVPSLPLARIDTTGITPGSLLVAGADIGSALAIGGSDWDAFTNIGGSGAFKPRTWRLGYYTFPESPASSSVVWLLPTDALEAINEITIELDRLGVSGSDQALLQFGTGSTPTWVTSGYNTTFILVGASTTSFASGPGMPISVAALGGYRPSTVGCRLFRLSGNTWKYTATVQPTIAGPPVGIASGTIVLGAPATAVRFTTSGSNTITLGSAAALARI